MKKRAKVKRKFGIRFFILLLLPVLAVGAYFAYKMKNPSHGRLSSDTVTAEREITGVIIRNETVIEASDYTAISYLKSEASEIRPNEAVATLYSKGYDAVITDIVAKSQEIYERQAASLRNMNEDRALPPEVLAFNTEISDAVGKMTRAAMNNEGDYLALYREMLDLLYARESYLASILPTEDNIALESKYTALTELKNKLNSYAVTLLHQGDGGFISFHLDGYENALNISSLTASQVRQIVSSPTADTLNNNSLYRVVDPDGFYIAFTVRATDAFRFVTGERYSLQVEHQDTVYEGRVISEKISSSYVLYIMEIEADAYPVLENRTIVFSVRNTASGVSIPVEGLFFNGGVPYVYAYTGKSYEPVAVEILCANDETAVIRAQNRTVQLHSGIKFEYHEEADS